MQIKCPECDFGREVNESQIPANSSFATCPKCGTRFRFRADPHFEHNAAPSSEPDSTPDISAAARSENSNSAPIDTDSAAHSANEGEQHERKPDEDIWDSMDKMRLNWDETEQDDYNAQQGHDASPHNNRPHYDEQEEAMRREAQRAYQQAASQGGAAIPFFSSVGSVPWEYRGGFLHPVVLFRTILLIVTRTPQFFSGINPFSSILPAWLFLLLARGVQMAVAIVNTRLVNTLPDGSQEILTMLDIISLPMLIVVSVCMLTMMHFLGSFIVNYTIQMHSGGKANFRLTFKVMAYANIPVLLAVIPVVGSMLGMFAALLLLFFGIRYAYAFSWRKTLISVMPYLLLSLLFVMMMLQAAGGAA